jgi:hypothetical protein
MKSIIFSALILCFTPTSHGESEYAAWRRAQLEAAPRFERAIRDAREVTLLVFDPHSRYSKKKTTDAVFEKPQMEGSWTIMKQLALADRKKQKRLAESLRSAIEHFEGGVPNCFEPRHGIRVSMDGKDVTIMICFQCSQAYVNGFTACEGFVLRPQDG